MLLIKLKKIIEPKEIPPKEKWENRDFKIKDKEEEIKTTTKIPYKDQWETRDFYVPNKRYDVVVLNDKTVTYQDYIQQLFLLDKENREKIKNNMFIKIYDKFYRKDYETKY